MTSRKHFALAQKQFHDSYKSVYSKMSSAAAAERLGVSESSVVRWKRDKRKAEGVQPARKKRLWIHRRPPFPKYVRDSAKLIRAWKRGKGVAAHLDALT